MNIPRLLNKRDLIYSICAVWIVLFHTFRRISMPFIPVLTNLIGLGNMGVDVFLFFSGLCLSLSVKKHNYPKIGWRDYYKRRLTRILVPYLIICMPYYLWSAIFEYSGDLLHKVIRFLANFSSATFWLKGTQTTWYVYAIVVFYILFPAIYTFTLKNKRGKRIALLTAMIVFAVISAYVPVLKNSMIAWARLPIFTIGVMMGADRREYKKPKSSAIVASVIVTLLLGTIISVSEISDKLTIPQVYRLLLYIPMTLSIMLLLSLFDKNRGGTAFGLGIFGDLPRPHHAASPYQILRDHGCAGILALSGITGSCGDDIPGSTKDRGLCQKASV